MVNFSQIFSALALGAETSRNHENTGFLAQKGIKSQTENLQGTNSVTRKVGQSDPNGLAETEMSGSSLSSFMESTTDKQGSEDEFQSCEESPSTKEERVRKKQKLYSNQIALVSSFNPITTEIDKQRTVNTTMRTLFFDDTWTPAEITTFLTGVDKFKTNIAHLEDQTYRVACERSTVILNKSVMWTRNADIVLNLGNQPRPIKKDNDILKKMRKYEQKGRVEACMNQYEIKLDTLVDFVYENYSINEQVTQLLDEQLAEREQPTLFERFLTKHELKEVVADLVTNTKGPFHNKEKNRLEYLVLIYQM